MATANYKPVRTVGTATGIALGLTGLYWAAEGITSFGLLNDQEAFASVEWLETLTDLEAAYPLLFITTAVLFIIWSFGSHSNLRHLGREGVRHQDQATIWWWIVPFANLVMPFRVAFETARGSTAAPSNVNWRTSRLPAEAIWWTALFILGLATTNAGARMISEAQDFSEFETGLTVSLVGEIAMIGGAIAAVLMIKRIVLGQEAMARELGVSRGGAVAALQASSDRPPLASEVATGNRDRSGSNCLSCGAELSGADNYCASCGRAVADPRSGPTGR